MSSGSGDAAGNHSSEHQTLLPNDTPVLQRPDGPLRMNLLTGTAVLAQLGIWAILVVVWYETLFTDLILVSWHPLLNSLALVLLVNAILIVQPTHTQAQKQQGGQVHGILHCLALLSFGTAAAIMFYNKASHGAAHYTTWHGKFGLTTALLLSTQVLVGAGMFWLPNWLGGETKAKALYKYHRAFGYVLSALVLTTVTLGTQSDWFLGKIRVLWVWLLFDALILAGLAPRIRPNKMKIF
ncbi:eukaryotic cytochrome b561-domain-containing protein [Protomyces lactucae-debilis]|uniref:Eukaryotic cytochrome b561-domain-containing protein n=1 Tax=Protomyces lactucae-debilis TaxID=2754530 RepID=A0A1Y2F1R6_PROLT|nr:eukaryotic cytochrome b561-domain-containing protein [Protomyces lactucae-debilis]ORY77809.1 eukaryotic cytochrome b561-domain-containing protein [Protomyces lactucae-debilis]